LRSVWVLKNETLKFIQMENKSTNVEPTSDAQTDANTVLAAVGLTKEEESELQLLRLLQADNRRWLSMWEFNRIAELSRKAFEGAGSPHCR